MTPVHEDSCPSRWATKGIDTDCTCYVGRLSNAIENDTVFSGQKRNWRSVLLVSSTRVNALEAENADLRSRLDEATKAVAIADATSTPTGYVRVLGDPNLGTPGGLYRVIPHARKKPLPPGVLHASLHRVPE